MLGMVALAGTLGMAFMLQQTGSSSLHMLVHLFNVISICLMTQPDASFPLITQNLGHILVFSVPNSHGLKVFKIDGESWKNVVHSHLHLNVS